MTRLVQSFAERKALRFQMRRAFHFPPGLCRFIDIEASSVICTMVLALLPPLLWDLDRPFIWAPPSKRRETVHEKQKNASSPFFLFRLSPSGQPIAVQKKNPARIGLIDKTTTFSAVPPQAGRRRNKMELQPSIVRPPPPQQRARTYSSYLSLVVCCSVLLRLLLHH